jgi:hypothetical protein
MNVRGASGVVTHVRGWRGLLSTVNKKVDGSIRSDEES